MQYGKSPYPHRRNFTYTKKQSLEDIDNELQAYNEIENMSIKIPSPNEPYETIEVENETRKKQIPQIFSFIKDHIKIDEIILIGLIFILLEEDTENDFLIIILIYLLLAGR